MNTKYSLQINISIGSDRGDRLNVSEYIEINAKDFLEIAAVLGKFHDLAQALKDKK